MEERHEVSVTLIQYSIPILYKLYLIKDKSGVRLARDYALYNIGLNSDNYISNHV